MTSSLEFAVSRFLLPKKGGGFKFVMLNEESFDPDKLSKTSIVFFYGPFYDVDRILDDDAFNAGRFDPSPIWDLKASFNDEARVVKALYST